MTRQEDTLVQELADVLQRERSLLEELRYRFVSLELLAEAREARFLGWAARDLARDRRRVCEVDLTRAAIVGQMNLKSSGPMPSLREVAATARAPWAGILRDHHDGLASVVAEIELHGHRVAGACRDGLAALARGTEWAACEAAPAPVHDAVPVAALVGAPDGPPAPAPGPGPGAPPALDAGSVEVLLTDVLAVGSRLRMPALLAFLR